MKEEIYNQQHSEDITNLEKKQQLSTASKDGELIIKHPGSVPEIL
jgi:hypothetical protein